MVIVIYLVIQKNCTQKPTSRAKTRRLLFLVHTAHRFIDNSNLWDLQGNYGLKNQESQTNLLNLSAIITSALGVIAFSIELFLFAFTRMFRHIIAKIDIHNHFHSIMSMIQQIISFVVITSFVGRL